MTNAAEPNWLTEHEKAAWLAMLALLQRAFPEIERDMRRQDDLVGPQYHIFTVLSDAPNQQLRLADLASAANVSPSRLTHRLRPLVERGDIEVAPDPDDKRAKQAVLTAQGRKRLERAAVRHVETVRRVIFDHLTLEQSKAIASALEPVVKSLYGHPEYLNPQCATSPDE